MRSLIRLHRRPGRGAQSTVEMMLLISVIVVAIVWLGQDTLWPELADGLQAMQDRIAAMSSDGVVDGH